MVHTQIETLYIGNYTQSSSRKWFRKESLLKEEYFKKSRFTFPSRIQQ